MKKSRFSEEQIAYAPRMADGGTPVMDVCRQIGISEATFYTWKKRYGELGVSKLRKLRPLGDENARLRRIVADLTLDKQILQEIVKKSSEDSQAPRAGSLDAGALQVNPTKQPACGAELSGFQGNVSHLDACHMHDISAKRCAGYTTSDVYL
jgi:putative transposase